MKENEYKIMISKSQYDLLNKGIAWDDVFSQINFYYSDKQNMVVSKGIVIRVRGIKDKLYLQIKLPEIRQGNNFISTEFEKPIMKIPLIIEEKELVELCHDMAFFTDVFLQGFLQTNRSLKRLENQTILFLDENSYLGITDYEVEIEYSDYNELQNTLSFLSSYNIDLNSNGLSKNKRFNKRKEQQR